MSEGEGRPAAEVLTDRQASESAREWIDHRIEKPAGYTRSQTRWLMKELGQLCIAETLRCREGEPELCARLARAWDIIHSIWYVAAPDYATKFYWSDEDQRDEQDRERIEKARHIVWHRRDPMQSYREGYESPSHTSFNTEDFAHAVADYLQRPWLRHPFLDWIIVDMAVSRELCAYGEELKKQWLPGQRDFLGLHDRYFKARGNLEVMTKIDWNEIFERWNARFWGAIGIPVGAIWAAFYFQYDRLAGWGLGIYLSVIVVTLIVWVLRSVSRVLRQVRGKPDPRFRPFELWAEMYEVWRLLEGPVVNPQRVRDAMQATTERGAVWDNSAWSVIDRVVHLNPAVWIPHPTQD